jgi:hypothetical protein
LQNDEKFTIINFDRKPEFVGGKQFKNKNKIIENKQEDLNVCCQ